MPDVEPTAPATLPRVQAELDAGEWSHQIIMPPAVHPQRLVLQGNHTIDLQRLVRIIWEISPATGRYVFSGCLAWHPDWPVNPRTLSLAAGRAYIRGEL
jgi:hypothetical protein